MIQRSSFAKIQHVATKIRERFEERILPRGELAELYHQYNSQVNEEAFIEEAYKIFPKLNCGLASAYLKNLLGGEVVHGMYGADRHTFLLLNQKIIVDITADQYGGPRVYVGEIKYPWVIT